MQSSYTKDKQFPSNSKGRHRVVMPFVSNDLGNGRYRRSST